jgi:hypothetical protein
MPGLEAAKAPPTETSSEASGLAELKAQLAEGTGPTTYVEEDTSATDTQVEDPNAGGTAVATEEEAPAETTEEGESGGEAEPEETEFAVTDSDRDYSDEAYQRAAAHYAKVTGVELDPVAHRKILRELMDRGQKIKELQAAQERPADEKTEEGEEQTAEAVEEKPPAKAVEITPQQMMANARTYAKSRVVPEIAMSVTGEFVDRLANIIWPGKDLKPSAKITQEDANAFTEFLSTLMTVQIADAMPSILGSVPQVMDRDPVYGRVKDLSIREAAVETIEDMKAPDGKTPLYPDFEALTNSGAIKRTLNTPEFKALRLSKDPVKNLVEKTKLAIKVCRGEAGSSESVAKAVARGRTEERKTTQAQSAARLSPGRSKGGFDTGSAKTDFVNNLLTSKGGKFSKFINSPKK